MNARLVALSTLIVFGTGACRTTPGDSKLKDGKDFVDPSSIKVLACESGETASFVLQVPSEKPVTSDFPALPQAPDEVETTADSLLTRLDVCMEGETLNIKRILTGYADAPTVVSVTTGATVEGLYEAVFDQNYSKLKIRIPFVKLDTSDGLTDTNQLFYMQGSLSGKSAIATIAADVAGSIEYATSDNANRFMNTYHGGILEYEEPVASKGCKSLANASGTFTLGTASFAWLGRSNTGTSGGTAPSLCQVTVVDTAKQLGENAQKPVVVEFAINGSDEAYKFTSNHHSVCDSFILKTSFASYAATANSSGFGGGTCNPPVAGAPKADKVGTNFIFTYGTKKVSGTQKNCKHPTRNCPTSAASVKLFKR